MKLGQLKSAVTVWSPDKDYVDSDSLDDDADMVHSHNCHAGVPDLECAARESIAEARSVQTSSGANSNVRVCVKPWDWSIIVILHFSGANGAGPRSGIRS